MLEGNGGTKCKWTRNWGISRAVTARNIDRIDPYCLKKAQSMMEPAPEIIYLDLVNFLLSWNRVYAMLKMCPHKGLHTPVFVHTRIGYTSTSAKS